MEKKLVICDIDSTLVVKHEALTPRARKVITELRERGIYFGIASGRSIGQVKRMVEEWGFDDFEILISMNGCVLWDGIDKKQYEQFYMKKEWLKEVVEFMSNYPTLNTLMYVDDVIIYAKEDGMIEYSSKASGMQAIKVSSMEAFYQADNAKIMFRVEEDVMKELEAYFEAHPNDNYQAFKTQPTMLEFCDRHVSKAFALKKFCALHDMELADVTAFGDTSNDNEMLEVSGWGVCMQNGSEDTKAIADEITEKSCDDDGWADYMEQHYLPKL